MLFTVTLALALGPHPPPLRRGNTLTRRAVLMPTLATGSAALLAVAAAKPASASFGPAGAAVFSVPDLIKINVEEWLTKMHRRKWRWAKRIAQQDFRRWSRRGHGA